MDLPINATCLFIQVPDSSPTHTKYAINTPSNLYNHVGKNGAHTGRESKETRRMLPIFIVIPFTRIRLIRQLPVLLF